MTDVNTASTDLTSQYAAQVSSDLVANLKEQDRVTADIAALQEQLAALERDHAVLLNVQQALGVSATPVTPAQEAAGTPESGTPAEEAAKDVTVPAPRRKAPATAMSGQRAKKSTAPRSRSTTRQSKSPAGTSSTGKSSTGKSPSGRPSDATSTGAGSTTGVSAPAADAVSPAGEASAAKTSVAKAATAKAPAAKAPAKSAAVKSASTAAKSGKSAQSPEAGRSETAGAKPGRPTLVELVRAHLAEQKEPRSAAEVATALGAAHPDRAVKPTVVRTTLEGLVARNHAQRSKQGPSVFYTAADRTGPEPVSAESAKS